MNAALRCHAVPGTPGPFLVDGFRHQGAFSPRTKSFFLSHFHGDHYTGLKPEFNQGTIYCSAITRALCVHVLGVDAARVVAMDLGCRTQVEGVFVTLFDANHCPGAVMFQFEAGEERTILHTGDMRFHEKMLQYEFKKPIDTLFLDTTYNKPKYVFLPQVDAIAMGVDVVTGRLPGVAQTDIGEVGTGWRDQTLFLVGAYNIGKERLLLALGKALGGAKIAVDPKKMAGQISCVFSDKEERESLFTVDEAESNVHVCRMSFCGEMWPFFRPNFVPMQQYLDRVNAMRPQNAQFKRVVGIIPTGWAGTSKWNRKNSISRKGRCTVVLIPYSEHSSFNELERFAKGVKARHIEPTVFDGESDRLAIMSRFHHLTDRTACKRRFLQMMGGGSSSSPPTPTPTPPTSSSTFASSSSSTSSSSSSASYASSSFASSLDAKSDFAPESAVIDLTGEDTHADAPRAKKKPRNTGTLNTFFKKNVVPNKRKL